MIRGYIDSIRRMRLIGLLLVVAPLAGAELVVTNESDNVNGDVSSPSALQSSPGADGVSLREAILAATRIAGPHVIRIDALLAGRAIHLGSALPEISTDGITIAGPLDSAGQPLVTIVTALDSNVPVLSVRASRFGLFNLEFTELRQGGAVAIRTGRAPAPPNELNDIRIEGNRFKGRAGTVNNAVTCAVENGSVNGSITNVTIASNTFIDILSGGDSIGMGAGQTVNGRLTNVFVRDNLFIRASLGVEIASSADGGRVEHVYIQRNTFLENGQAITLTGAIGIQGFAPARGNITRDIIVTNNFIARSKRAGLALVGALDATSSVLEDVEISNNLIVENQGLAIYIIGGQSLLSPAEHNRVGPLRIVNNTITAGPFGTGLSVDEDLGDKASGNEITDVRVVNTLFTNEPGAFDISLGRELVEVSHCVIADPLWLGVNANIAGDPLFVDRAGGDYHLRAGSVAMDAGTFAYAPLLDLDGLHRRGFPDIGAYEFMGFRPRRRAVSRGALSTP